MQPNWQKGPKFWLISLWEWRWHMINTPVYRPWLLDPTCIFSQTENSVGFKLTKHNIRSCITSILIVESSLDPSLQFIEDAQEKLSFWQRASIPNSITYLHFYVSNLELWPVSKLPKLLLKHVFMKFSWWPSKQHLCHLKLNHIMTINVILISTSRQIKMLLSIHKSWL